MEAHIKPLHGKYYGTEIVYQLPGEDVGSLQVWDRGDGTPSQRQLEDWGMTLQEARDDDMMCDSHYETTLSYRIAEIVRDALLAVEE
jgi:hypothetical protein